MQALETVPGINQVSEGHASVPAVRGLARGRTLFLIDGGRVTAERRVGPSGTFLDPSVIEGIDVARGPGSVAYGSDALGGVISVRTRRAEPGSPLRARVTGTFGARRSGSRGSFEVSKGFARGGVLVQAHVRNAEDYDSPEGEVFNSGWEDQGFLVQLHPRRRQGVAVGGMAERLRPRLRAAAQQLADGALLLSVRELAPLHGVLRGPRTSRGFRRDGLHRLPRHLRAANRPGPLCHRDDRAQHRARRRVGQRLPREGQRRAPVRSARGSSSASTSTAATASRRSTSSRPTTSRARLRATRPTCPSKMRAASIPASTCRRSRRSAASARVSGGIRGDHVTTKNIGGYFGDRSTSNAAASGFGALTVGAVRRLQRHRRRSRAASAIRCCRIAISADRRAAASSPAIPTWSPRPACSSISRPATRVGAHAVGDLLLPLPHHRPRSSATGRRPTSSSSATAAAPGCAAVEVEARSDLGTGYSIEVGAQIARGRALDDNANLDDISPATFSVLGRKEFDPRLRADAPRFGTARTTSGPERDRGAGRDPAGSRRRLEARAAAGAARPVPERAGRHLLRQPGRPVGVRGRSIGQLHRGRPVLTRRRSQEHPVVKPLQHGGIVHESRIDADPRGSL